VTTPLHRIPKRPTDIRARYVGPLVSITVFLIPALSRDIGGGDWPVLGVAAVVALSLIAVLGVATFEQFRTSTRHPAILALIALTLFMAIALVFHPTAEGTIHAGYLAFGTLLALVIGGFGRDELGKWVAAPVLLAASLQAIVVAAQSMTGEPVVLRLIDSDAALQITNAGRLVRPQGTMAHVYEVVAYALLAIGLGAATFPAAGHRRFWWSGGLFGSAAILALTYSRAAVAGFVAVIGFLVAARIRGTRAITPAIVALVIGFAVPATMSAQGWQLRWTDTATTDLDAAGLGRITLMKQALTMIGDHPAVGVGPTRYLTVIEEEYSVDDRFPYVVHNVPLLAGAETGFLQGVVFTALLGWALLRGIKAGPVVAAAALAPIGFLLFDALHYDRSLGLILTAVWLGSLDALDTYGSGDTAEPGRISAAPTPPDQ
jgi:O-antigen ligase